MRSSDQCNRTLGTLSFRWHSLRYSKRAQQNQLDVKCFAELKALLQCLQPALTPCVCGVLHQENLCNVHFNKLHWQVLSLKIFLTKFFPNHLSGFQGILLQLSPLPKSSSGSFAVRSPQRGRPVRPSER